MLSIVTRAEADDPRLGSCLRRLWLVARPFEHVVVLNCCSDIFTGLLRDLLHEAPAHVTTVLAADDIAVARQGIPELLTPPDNEHSRLQFEKRCFAKCSNLWRMATTVDFTPTPNWIVWFNSLELGILGQHPVAISMHSRLNQAPAACRPKLFNFVPSYRRHYWWPVLDAPDDLLSIQNREADSFESEQKPDLVTACEPWFAGQEPTLESAWSYAQCLLAPTKEDHRAFIKETTELFAPDGTWLDSRHSQWVQLGAAAICTMRDQHSNWRLDPVFASVDLVSHAQASAYWSQIMDFEFEVVDLQPICTECDREGGLVPEKWPDGLLASAVTLKHVWHALFIMDRIWDVKTVVEVGAGYGGFAKAFLLCAQLCDRVVESYTILELPALRPLCERYLHDHQAVISFGDASLGGSDVDKGVSLFVSLNGVSELADQQKNTYLDTLLPRAKNVCLLWACTQIPDVLYDHHAAMDLFLPDSAILIYGPKR